MQTLLIDIYSNFLIHFVDFTHILTALFPELSIMILTLKIVVFLHSGVVIKAFTTCVNIEGY